MKKIKSLAALLLLSCSLIFSGCVGDYDEMTTTREIIIRGKWAVDYFYVGADRTAEFRIYELTFNSNGFMICACKNDVFDGTWQLRQGSNKTDILQLQLPLHQPDLKELNLNWKVDGLNLSEISMKEESKPAKLRLRKL
ncbi:MAG: hypothetical protein M3342_22345 [Bacteroidota bacterium]|nr:hypothetical protein [Flavisolibacter sp.]MDQ3846726.1 hypothetical protein [Bacteroidota bacterium]MBD0287574.1 hypothetical protein [Flavisolibacter sp.]MBD0297314.1 hypothetical protein [Flavisolibacter sp.]MBD0349851.1 hypothetical protein [Flavisolibacter sp.]